MLISSLIKYCERYTLNCFGFIVMRADKDSDLGRVEGRCMNDSSVKCPLLNFGRLEPDSKKISLQTDWDYSESDMRIDILYGLQLPTQFIEACGEDELRLVPDLFASGPCIFSPLHRRITRNSTGQGG